jgi:hypothetical protein
MKESCITFSDEFANEEALILQIKSTATSKIIIYDVERTETAAQALPAFLKAITTISAHQQECTGVYMPSVGIVVRRKDDSRVEGNMDIWWSPSFRSDRVWFANENGCAYLEIA